jgi:hypothetical protein
LRSPNEQDTAHILAQNEARGFPGMLGSIDYMYLVWKNCPSAWQGIYKGYTGACNVTFEAVADYYLWIWHTFLGMEESHDDINVLQRSPTFTKGNAPSVNYVIKRRTPTPKGTI